MHKRLYTSKYHIAYEEILLRRNRKHFTEHKKMDRTGSKFSRTSFRTGVGRDVNVVMRYCR
jgi:hypothetical protein